MFKEYYLYDIIIIELAYFKHIKKKKNYNFFDYK